MIFLWILTHELVKLNEKSKKLSADTFQVSSIVCEFFMITIAAFFSLTSKGQARGVFGVNVTEKYLQFARVFLRKNIKPLNFSVRTKKFQFPSKNSWQHPCSLFLLMTVYAHKQNLIFFILKNGNEKSSVGFCSSFFNGE